MSAVYVHPLHGRAISRSRAHQLRNNAKGKCTIHAGRDCAENTLYCRECLDKRRAKPATKNGKQPGKLKWQSVDWNKSDQVIGDELGVSKHAAYYHRNLRYLPHLILENGLKVRARFTYFFLCAETGAVKIGASANEERRRIQLQSDHKCKLERLCVLPYSEWPESFVHKMFKADRIDGEWFRYSDHMKAFLSSVLTKATGEGAR